MEKEVTKEVTKELLEQYRNIIQEISDQEKRINKLYEKEIPIINGTVKASSSEFPYNEYRIGVLVEEPVEVQIREKLIERKEKRLKQLKKIALEIETFIDEITDSELRLMFEYRYIDGMKQSQIADLVHLDRSRVSRKMKAYLEDAHKAQK